ncbi:hypothetical protein GPN2_10707 [Streptomyces murinus]
MPWRSPSGGAGAIPGRAPAFCRWLKRPGSDSGGGDVGEGGGRGGRSGGVGHDHVDRSGGPGRGDGRQRGRVDHRERCGGAAERDRIRGVEVGAGDGHRRTTGRRTGGRGGGADGGGVHVGVGEPVVDAARGGDGHRDGTGHRAHGDHDADGTVGEHGGDGRGAAEGDAGGRRQTRAVEGDGVAPGERPGGRAQRGLEGGADVEERHRVAGSARCGDGDADRAGTRRRDRGDLGRGHLGQAGRRLAAEHHAGRVGQVGAGDGHQGATAGGPLVRGDRHDNTPHCSMKCAGTGGTPRSARFHGRTDRRRRPGRWPGRYAGADETGEGGGRDAQGAVRHRECRSLLLGTGRRTGRRCPSTLFLGSGWAAHRFVTSCPRGPYRGQGRAISHHPNGAKAHRGVAVSSLVIMAAAAPAAVPLGHSGDPLVVGLVAATAFWVTGVAEPAGRPPVTRNSCVSTPGVSVGGADQGPPS